ncbi:MAG: lipid II flippase MurJ [Candidatus Paceibacterota bacterium]
MVDKLLQFLGREFGNLHQAAFLIAGSSLLAQFLGLFRDRLLAGTFGASIDLDIYYIAFKVPDLLYVSFASCVSVTVLIPFILKHKRAGDKEEVKNFLSDTLSLFLMIMLGAVIVIFFLLPYLAPVIAPGFSEESLKTLVTLSRILLLSPFILGISNLFGSVTQSYKKFLAYTLSPILYNLGIIIGIVFFYPVFGLNGLIWGVVVGAGAHLLVQMPSVYSLGVMPQLRLVQKWKEMGQLIIISIPRTITLTTHHLSLLVLISLGSLMAVGSIAIFNLAFNLQSFTLIVVGVSYSVAAFPTLASLFSSGDVPMFVSKIETAIRHIFFWTMPAIALFIVLRAHIVRVVLGSGEFSWADTRLTAAVLAMFVISVAAQGLVQLFVRAYYASGRTRTPLLINSFSSVVIILLAFILVYIFKSFPEFRLMIEKMFRVEGVPGTSVLMLPLAYSIGVTLNAFIYWLFFEAKFGAFKKETYIAVWESFLSALVVGASAYFVLSLYSPILRTENYLGIFTHGAIAGLVGVICGFGALMILGSLELKELILSFKTKVWKKPIRSDAEEV